MLHPSTNQMVMSSTRQQPWKESSRQLHLHPGPYKAPTLHCNSPMTAPCSGTLCLYVSAYNSGEKPPLAQGLSEEEVQAAARTAAADAAQASDLVNRTSGAADAQERSGPYAAACPLTLPLCSDCLATSPWAACWSSSWCTHLWPSSTPDWPAQEQAQGPGPAQTTLLCKSDSMPLLTLPSWPQSAPRPDLSTLDSAGAQICDSTTATAATGRPCSALGCLAPGAAFLLSSGGGCRGAVQLLLCVFRRRTAFTLLVAAISAGCLLLCAGRGSKETECGWQAAALSPSVRVHVQALVYGS